MMIQHSLPMIFTHQVYFGESVFVNDGEWIKALKLDPQYPAKVLVLMDRCVAESWVGYESILEVFFSRHQSELTWVAPVQVVAGGESSKNEFSHVEQIWELVNRYKIDRHSYLWIIGGGAVLDWVGFAASTAHRGIRHVRFPTTTLSQADGGVGVKNGTNYFGKKNWIGTFTMPYAVINDFQFIRHLPLREKRNGLIEALKVALIKDSVFYHWIREHQQLLAQFDESALKYLIEQCAKLHLDHICTSGDPFERGSARPLDFGHWVAHQLEQLSDFEVTHGEAVAIGIAVDMQYSVFAGIGEPRLAGEVIDLIQSLGFKLYHPALDKKTDGGEYRILRGLNEFREHLGGQLTITLVPTIGQSVEVHHMQENWILESIQLLRARVN
jgi:3-dehydroquinate synthase